MTERGLAPAVPSRRTDARRNRDKILAAATAAFSEPGADVSMAEIARRAGIGSATLYRNFADRRALLEALYGEEIAAICRAAENSDGDTDGERLTAWLRQFYDYFTHKRALASALLEHTDEQAPVFGTGYARVRAAAESLAGPARESGELRSDLSTDQVLALVVAVANVPGDPAFRAPVLDAALEALHPSRSPQAVRAADALAPTPAEIPRRARPAPRSGS